MILLPPALPMLAAKFHPSKRPCTMGHRNRGQLGSAILLLIAALTLCAVTCPFGVAEQPGASGDPAKASHADYSRRVKPLLRQRCYACHGALKQESGLRLDTVQAMLRGGDSGPVIAYAAGGALDTIQDGQTVTHYATTGQRATTNVSKKITQTGQATFFYTIGSDVKDDGEAGFTLPKNTVIGSVLFPAKNAGGALIVSCAEIRNRTEATSAFPTYKIPSSVGQATVSPKTTGETSVRP